ncbi:MAG: rhodanese-like domain-containing protein [bacterium]|nr:rhodanese-like domain-containing protein [bacterium]
MLDVRGASEYQAGHVEGALSIAHTRLPAAPSCRRTASS